MGMEIERKYLLAGDGWRAHIAHSQRLVQGYLAGGSVTDAFRGTCTVRVRIGGSEAWLTVKSNVHGIARQEYEYPIPLADAERMLQDLASEGTVEKVRHHVVVEGTLFEIDEFGGANAGLIVAEVELPDVAATHPRPDWLGLEVSEAGRYYNVNLLRRPYAQWSAAERRGEPGA
jgi:adenylate cyclase